MLFNKLLQAVPILSFSVNADMPVGMLPIDFWSRLQSGGHTPSVRCIFLCWWFFSPRQELPFSGEKGKKFGMTQAFFTSFQLSASCCVRTTSASSFLQPPPVSFSNAVRFACMGIPVVPSDAGYECMVWLYGILLFLRFHHPVVSENPILGPMCWWQYPVSRFSANTPASFCTGASG